MPFDLNTFKFAYEKWASESLLVKFPRGSMLGEPDNAGRQRRVILDALKALSEIAKPGTVQELPYRWKKPDPE